MNMRTSCCSSVRKGRLKMDEYRIVRMSNQDIDRPNECFVSGFPSFSNERVAHTFAAKLTTL